MRAFLRDLLVAERQEFERIDFAKDDEANWATVTADNLWAAQRDLDGLAPAAAATPAIAPPLQHVRRPLLVCVGAESGLLLDLAALRAATGLNFQRLLNATRVRLADALRRERGFGQPVEFVHVALHTSERGIEFADGPADGAWLNERLGGVRVVLLASCASERVGDQLGAVPYVVSLGDEISHEDAAVLTRHFWQGIGLGKDPGEALDGALELCLPAVGEFVVRHW